MTHLDARVYSNALEAAEDAVHDAFVNPPEPGTRDSMYREIAAAALKAAWPYITEAGDEVER